MNTKKIGIYICLPLLMAGIGTYFFLFQHQEDSESSLTEAVDRQKSATTSPSVSVKVSPIPSSSLLHNPATRPSVPSASLDQDGNSAASAKKLTENEQYFQKIGQYDNLELLNKLESFLKNDSSAEKDQIAAEITERLRKTADSAITDRIAELLASNTLPDDQQNYLLNFLGKLGTLDAVQALTSLIPQLKDGTAKEELAQVFSNISKSRWDTDMFAKNPHPLEQAWQSVSGDELLEPAVADAIAGIGTPNGIALLFKSLDDDADSNYSDETARIISNALAKTANFETIQLLGETLRNSSSRRAAYVAGYALAHNTSQEQSVRNLLDWASNASEEDSNLVDEWLRASVENNSSAVDVLVNESAGKKFDSQKIENVVSLLASEYKSR